MDGDYLNQKYVSEFANTEKLTLSRNLQRKTWNAAETAIRNNRYLSKKFENKTLDLQFDELPFMQNRSAIGVTLPNWSIRLNPEYYSDKNGVKDYLLDSENFFVKVNDKNKDKYPVVHEIGHVLHNELWSDFLKKNPNTQINRNEFVDNEVDKIYTMYQEISGKSDAYKRLPSEYANASPREAFAEIFVLSQIGDSTSNWSKTMKKYLKELI